MQEADRLAMGAGRVYFVSGIDTGIGKTMVAGIMARSLAAAGRDAITVKMVQTGNVGFSEDLEMHRAMCGGVRFPEDADGLTAPQIFKFPSSPQLAASLEGRIVDTTAIVRAVRRCAEHHEIVLVESAGGLAVPLTEKMLSVDLAASEGWPLVLVTCGRLGSINHTLLSLEAAKSRGMSVAGVVHNWCDGVDSTIDADTRKTVSRRLAMMGFPPIVIEVPRFNAEGPYPDVDFSEMFA